MGEPIPWKDEVKRTSKLTIALDPSIGQQGWAKPFQDGVAAFNALAAQVRLGVTYELTNDLANANVVAHAKTTNFKFSYDDGTFKMEEKEYTFDGTSLHGHCSMLSGNVRNRATRSYELRMIRAFIFVPAKPRTDGGRSRLVGDPVKMVVAVHEMVHACGLDDGHHTVDDVFCWPKAKYDPQNPDNDRMEAFSGQREPIVIAGKQMTRPVMVSMPPIVLNAPTQEKIRRLWAAVSGSSARRLLWSAIADGQGCPKPIRHAGRRSRARD